jgi:adenylate cyclase
MIPRWQSFGTRLLLVFVAVVAAAQFATWFIVSRANRVQARTRIEEELGRAERILGRIISERNTLLRSSAAAAARDYALKPLLISDDAPTLASALRGIQRTSGADVVTVLNLQGAVLGSTTALSPTGDFYRLLVGRADANESDQPTASGYGYLDNALNSFVIAPVRAPDIVAWLALGFRIDQDLVNQLKQQTGVDLTFFDASGRVIASTLDAAHNQAFATATRGLTANLGVSEIPIGDDTALISLHRIPAGRGNSTLILLHCSLEEKLAPSREAERWLLAVALGSLGLAAIASREFARRLTKPILGLVQHTRRIAEGNYAARLDSRRQDELGLLAASFDSMSAGLAERDRVRDLLDKNVSPEIAARLLRDGATLGGEEREVTVLFADLRGFTALSEQLPPRELIDLLNRHLDRMSAEVEREGGVIDKFIGDSIMALFGAPLAQADAAERAIAAARGMERALASLNLELAGENRGPLALGIGINTARVVAGNIGSHRRLNYSVVGDGVNIAARLQTETRRPEHRTNIIVSAATANALSAATRASLRPLHRVAIKGRSETVEILAADAPAA